MKKLILYLSLFFSTLNVTIAQTKNIESSLVLLDIHSGEEKIILQEKRHFEAPNWSRDGKYLVINSNGLLEKISIDGEKLGTINTSFANRCNNDHGFSFDGKTLIISHNDTGAAKGNNSRIFVLPAEGGTPKLVTEKHPSYWHGISPDGQTLVYCAMRNNNYDVYKISINGGEEVRLTDAEGLDDGPEYSYDGEWIYFNSHRTGRMHLYRMKPDGTAQEQLTNDEFDNWFAHPAPDGKSLVYISYMEDQKGQHPFGKEVRLRLLDVETKKIKDLTPVFYGGQGSLNVPSWSPDGKRIAYVRYRQL